jgi:hypothetical protein
MSSQIKIKDVVYPIIINGNSLVSDSFNNKYRYDFPVGSVSFNSSKVAVNNISMYYSWFNITSNENNNTFSFIWDGTLTVQHDVSIDDGFYDISSLNSYLQDYCVNNDLYLVDDSGDFVYYLEFVENPTYYAVQFNSYPIPTALPAGWTEPASWPGYPVSASTPQLIVNSDDDFGDIIGFNAGTYPASAQTTNYSKLSDYTPQVSNVQSIILTCDLLNNKYSIPNTALYSFSPSSVSFGSLITSEPAEHEYIDIQDGTYASVQISFLDQNFDPIYIRDTNLIVQLLIKNKEIEY